MESDKVVASLYLNQNISQSCGKKALKKKKSDADHSEQASCSNENS